MTGRVTVPRVLIGFVCFVVVWATTAALSIPIVFGWVPALIVLVLVRNNDTRAVALLAGSLLVAVGLLEVVLRILPGPISVYRPDERLFLAKELRYRANAAEDDYEMAHGDLVAMAGGGAMETAEPRRIRFKTDSLGYRNDRDYAGERLVVIGDSFTVGIGTTQDEILSVQLAARLGAGVYNASFPVEPDGYAKIVRRLEGEIGKDFKAVVLLFEGNDFECAGKNPSDKSWIVFVPGEIRRLGVYRLMFGMTHRLQASLLHKADLGNVRVLDIAGRPVAFYRLYMKQARRSAPCDWSLQERSLKAMAERVGLLVFVPDKYRVYRPLTASGEPLPPSPALAFVRRVGAEMGAGVVDLTPALQKAAAEGAPQGRFVYWRDDTHWNGAGIAAAAEDLPPPIRAAGLR